MKNKLQTIIHLLKEIDDELENEICLIAPEEDEPLTEFTFWGVATMIENYLENL